MVLGARAAADGRAILRDAQGRDVSMWLNEGMRPREDELGGALAEIRGDA